MKIYDLNTIFILPQISMLHLARKRTKKKIAEIYISIGFKTTYTKYIGLYLFMNF